MADQFCLRWNNFQTNIVSALDSLKCSEDLVDVTLTCEGRNIKAHKVILSACSPYFRNVFKENPCQHPVIILKDVMAEDIVSLLSYMYQGEVFIEESKLSSFLHTAALLQVKGLTGVTHQKEIITSPCMTNKLYTQLTISPKVQYSSNKDLNKIPALKKRRSSTSDKPNDVSFGANKKSKVFDSTDVYSPLPQLSKLVENQIIVADNNNVEKKNENKVETGPTTNGKACYSVQVSPPMESVSVTIKTEQGDDSDTPLAPPSDASDNDNSLPDYENSMLARSLLSGINPSKSDTSTPLSSMMKTNKTDIPCTVRSKDSTTASETVTYANSQTKSPLKIVTSDEPAVKSEKMSPKSDIDYEPEILLSEQQDDNDSEGAYIPEPSQVVIVQTGMPSVSGHGASTSQGVSHQQSNHAAICGDCPHCGMKYSNQSALKYHVRLMHSDLTNRLCCYLCPRSFTMRETFKEHMWLTHGQRN